MSQKPLFEDMPFTAEATAPEASVLERVTAALASQLREKTGLEKGDVTITQTFTVTLKPLEGDQVLTGSAATVDDAIIAATSGLKTAYKADEVYVRAEATIKAPYHLVEVKAMGLSERQLLENLAAQEESLRGQHLASYAGVDNRRFIVAKSRAKYQADRLPEWPSAEKFVGTPGESMTSAADAEANVVVKRKWLAGINSTVYLVEEHVKVYGRPHVEEAPAGVEAAVASAAEATESVAAMADASGPPNPRDRQEPVGTRIIAPPPRRGLVTRVAAAIAPAVGRVSRGYARGAGGTAGPTAASSPTATYDF